MLHTAARDETARICSRAPHQRHEHGPGTRARAPRNNNTRRTQGGRACAWHAWLHTCATTRSTLLPTRDSQSCHQGQQQAPFLMGAAAAAAQQQSRSPAHTLSTAHAPSPCARNHTPRVRALASRRPQHTSGKYARAHILQAPVMSASPACNARERVPATRPAVASITISSPRATAAARHAQAHVVCNAHRSGAHAARARAREHTPHARPGGHALLHMAAAPHGANTLSRKEGIQMRVTGRTRCLSHTRPHAALLW